MEADAGDLRPVGVGDVLEFAFRVYRQRFGTLVRATAVVVVPLWFLTAVVLMGTPVGEAVDPSATRPTEQIATDPAAPFAGVEASDAAFVVGGILVVGALSAVSDQLATAAGFIIVTGAYLGIARTWQESLAFAWRRLWPLLLLQLAASVGLILGFIALVVPGIYLIVAWAVAVPVLLFEDTRGWGALRRSRELLRGRWWPTAGLLALVAVMMNLFQALLGVVLPLLVAGTGSDTARNYAEVAAGLIGAVLTTPFYAAVITVLFFDAMVRKEGLRFDELSRAVELEPPADPLGPI